jgi:hypothetical protein
VDILDILSSGHNHDEFGFSQVGADQYNPLKVIEDGSTCQTQDLGPTRVTPTEPSVARR